MAEASREKARGADPTAIEHMSDIERAVEALKNKQGHHTTLWKYYDGKQPLIYSTERLKSVFKDFNARFSQNWVAVVIDSELDRLALKQLVVADDEEATEMLADLFEETELVLDADDVHKSALVIGEAFVIAWKDDDDKVEAYYNDPRLCHVFYKDENPHKKDFAAKWWKDAEDHYYLTLYYPDRLEYYRTKQSYKDNSEVKASAFEQSAEPAENPYDEVPVFHFRPDRRGVKSELANVVEPQNAINKLFSDMMVAAEFGAFRQRWIISNADTDALKNAPNEVWIIPAADSDGEPTKVGAFNPTDLDNFLKGIESVANFVATVTRTPKHYLFSTSGQLSGEALIALESPLNKKAQRHIVRFSATWGKLGAFMLKLKGQEAESRAISAVYDKPETIQPLTRAKIRQTNTGAGIPLRTILREEGKSKKEIEQVEEDKAQEVEARQLSFADALLERGRQFNGSKEAA